MTSPYALHLALKKNDSTYLKLTLSKAQDNLRSLPEVPLLTTMMFYFFTKKKDLLWLSYLQWNTQEPNIFSEFLHEHYGRENKGGKFIWHYVAIAGFYDVILVARSKNFIRASSIQSERRAELNTVWHYFALGGQLNLLK